MSNQNRHFRRRLFWCIEAVYNRLKGVHNATSGYINGHTPAPTYAEIVQRPQRPRRSGENRIRPRNHQLPHGSWRCCSPCTTPPSSTAKATMWAHNTAAAFIISMKRKKPKPKPLCRKWRLIIRSRLPPKSPPHKPSTPPKPITSIILPTIRRPAIAKWWWRPSF